MGAGLDARPQPENTVERYAHEVFRTLNVSTRTEALVAAVRHGLRIE